MFMLSMIFHGDEEKRKERRVIGRVKPVFTKEQVSEGVDVVDISKAHID